MKDSLDAKHQQAVKDSLSAKPQRATSDVFKSETSRVRGGNTLIILLPFEEEQAVLGILSKYNPIISETVPPIPPPLGTNPGNTGSPNRVDSIPVDNTNNTTTTNVAQNVMIFPVGWKDRQETQSIIFSCLPNNVMKSVIKCTTAKSMLNHLILAHEGPSDTKDIKIAALRLKFNPFKALKGEKVNGIFTRLKCLLNNIENIGVSIPQAEVNATFVNSLTKKWLSMNQTQRANNSIKNDSLATLYGKYNYEEGLINQIYESETQRFTVQASSSKASIFNNHFQDSDSDVEKDPRSSSEILS
ncbi:hypothetical protein Tco_1233735 [Tanacetum coccineum]